MKIKLIGNNDYFFNPKKTIYENRGITQFSDLEPTDDSVNHPSLFKNITEGAILLTHHITKLNKIHIIVDCDCDGSASSAVMYKFLTEVLNYPKHLISYHVHNNKEHGIILHELANYDYDLLIVPDAGTNDVKEQEILKKEGKSILVLDHHNITETLNLENAVVINSKDGQYPNPELSGVGVTYQFCRYYAILNRINFDERDFLDLVAVGLISDMVDSRVKENRYFMIQGLNNVRNKFLKNLINKKLYNKDLTFTNISFYIAPSINAIHRVGTKEEKIDLFRAFIDDQTPIIIKKRGKEEEIGFIVDDMIRQATNIKNRQDKERDRLVDSVLSQIDSNPIIMINIPQEVNRVFYGLLANTLANSFGKPAIVYSLNSKGTFSGSARGYELSGILNFNEYIRNSGLFIRAEGHDNAFGIEFQEDVQKIKEYFASTLSEVSEKTYYVDFIMDAKNLTKDFITMSNSMIPLYAEKFKEPYVNINNVIISGNDVFINEKKTILKFEYNGISYCLFFPKDETINLLVKENMNTVINIVGTCSINEYNGEKSYQVILDEYDFVCYNECIQENNDKLVKENWF